jgi:DNA polymerase III epsilon subunit-like protein
MQRQRAMSLVEYWRLLLREIVIDTETIGLDPLNGDRIVEIGGRD